MRYSLPARFSTIAAIGWLLMTTACSKQEDVQPDTDSLTATISEATAQLAIAQNWFEQPSRADNKSSSDAISSTVSSQTVPPAINWEKARITNEWVVAPFLDTSQPFSSLHKVGYRYVVIHTPVRGVVTGRIVELVLPETVKEPQAAQFALQATKSFVLTGRSSAIEGLSGWVLFYSPTYRYQTGVVYQEGNVEPKRVEIQVQKRTASTSSSQQRTSNSSTTPTSSLLDQLVCFSVTTCGTVMGQDAGCLTYPVCHVYTGGTDGGGYGGGGSGGDGGGGTPGGTSTSSATTPAGKFIMTIEDQRQHKKFTALVKGLKNFVLSDQKVMDALIKYTHLPKNEILDHLEFGKGPKISIENIPKGYGRYNGSTDPSTLFVDAEYVNNLEATSPYNTGAYQALNLLLAVTVLHEYVHYGDYTTGTNFQGEEGNAFELAGFGVIVTITNGFSVSLDRLNP